MEVTEILFVLLIAIIIGSLFHFGFRSRNPWGGFWVFLLILFFAAWAGRLWVAPIGPVFWGVAWIPITFFVFLIALIIAAAATPRSRYFETKSEQEVREGGRAAAVFGIFFWFLMIFFVAAIIVGLYNESQVS
ncbi:MAG: hypothetical protein R3277_12900 [Brumimicrobium sp.]|nr:hypothetical protein [Brumimicrobium sp.]